MSRNGSGVYTPPAASYPAVSGTLIESAKFNATIDDIATGLTESVAVNGQTAMTGDLPMGAHKVTGLANGVAATDACAYGQAGSAAIAETYTATSKATPVDADVMLLSDSAASFGLKKLTWANLTANISPFPAGTKMVFAQAAAPTGWTQDASNDRVLRVVSGAGGGSGGTLSITSTVTGEHALSAAENGVHSHAVTDPGHAHVQRVYSANSQSGNIPIGYGVVDADVSGPYSTNSAVTGISVQNSAGGAAHDHPLAIKYQDVIICSKN